MEMQELFMEQDVSGRAGHEGGWDGCVAGELERNGVITDVSFKSDKTRKYTKAKIEVG